MNRRGRWSFLLGRGWIGAIVAALVFAAACWFVLAPWQFGRNTERAAQNADITSSLTAAPVPVESLLRTTGEPDQRDTWHQVRATGVFDPSGQVYVRLRQDQQGNPASEVVVPFRLLDGTVLIVDRGYASADLTSPSAVPPTPPGQVTITGRVQPDQPDPSRRAPVETAGRMTVLGIDSRALAPDAASAGTLRIGFVQLVKGTPGALREIEVPQTDSGPFLSYALQWCVFGAFALLAIGFFVYREAFDPRDPDERDSAGPSRPASRPTRQSARDRSGFDRSQLYD